LLVGRNFLAGYFLTESDIVSIPLIKFSVSHSRWPWEKNGYDWNAFSTIRVNGHELVEGCYGVDIEDESMTPILKTGMTAVFSPSNSAQALKDIYSIGQKGESPLVRKVVKNEIIANEKTDVHSESLRPKRKSFMTPTPLHIPGSRVSPIPESTHETIYFKGLENSEQLILVPRGNLLWMHPLVLILNQEDV
jgi:hypothetical protein